MVLPYINMNLPQVYMCSSSWTLLPPSSPYHPSGSSQCTSPKHPVSFIEPGLATHFIYDYYSCLNAILPNHPTLSLSHKVHKTVLYISVSFVVSYGEGNGNPLQCSCLENPRDGGAWWAAVCGVAQSWTRLKRLSSSSSIQDYCYHLSKFHIYALVYCIGVFPSGLLHSV